MNLDIIRLNVEAYWVALASIIGILTIFWRLWCRERVVVLGLIASAFVLIGSLAMAAIALYFTNDPYMKSLAGRAGLGRGNSAVEFLTSGNFVPSDPISWELLKRFDPSWFEKDALKDRVNDALFSDSWKQKERHAARGQVRRTRTSSDSSAINSWTTMAPLLERQQPENWIDEVRLVETLCTPESNESALALGRLMSEVDASWREGGAGLEVARALFAIESAVPSEVFPAFPMLRGLELRRPELVSDLVELVSRVQTEADAQKVSDMLDFLDSSWSEGANRGWIALAFLKEAKAFPSLSLFEVLGLKAGDFWYNDALRSELIGLQRFIAQASDLTQYLDTLNRFMPGWEVGATGLTVSEAILANRKLSWSDRIQAFSELEINHPRSLVGYTRASFDVLRDGQDTRTVAQFLLRLDPDQRDQPFAGKTVVQHLYSFELVSVPSGTFQMGSNDGNLDERPLHWVELSGFWLGRTEVTYSHWHEVYLWARSNGYEFDNTGSGNGPDHPVHSVNWFDVVKWCNAASERGGLEPVYRTMHGAVYRTGRIQAELEYGNSGYRLPTEAEWEYACRAGTSTRFQSGDSDSALVAVAWYSSNSNRSTHPVGQKQANVWGLYDMHGNVWEWCNDWYGSYNSSSARDPQGPQSGTGRVNRGGSWSNTALLCRTSLRLSINPDYHNNNLGFRLSRSE